MVKAEAAALLNEQGILWFKARNYAEAQLWWEKAAAHGNASAMFGLGVLYLTSAYYDPAKAEEQFCRAEAAGHKNAKFQLERLHADTAHIYRSDQIFVRPVPEKRAAQKIGQYEWLPLQRDNGKTLYITKNIIDIRPYHTCLEPVTWSECTLRRWLNEEFIEAFSQDEKRKLCTAVQYNRENSLYGTDGGAQTNDRCFLLSYDELLAVTGVLQAREQSVDLLSPAEDHLPLVAEVQMSAERIQAAQERTGLDFSMINGLNLGWWLRTPGENPYKAVRVNCNGAIRLHGRNINRNLVGVRPAIWFEENV